MALTLDDKPWWVGLLVGIVLAVAIVFVTDYLLVKEIKQDIVTADNQIAELERKIQQGQAAERKLPQFREEVKRLELELEKLRRILPSTRNTEEIIKKLKSLVDQGEFTLKSLTFPPLGAGSADPYVEWPISVSVDGRYHDLAILFNRLGNFSRIMNVENISISALGAQEQRTITSSFTAKTFVYTEPVEEKPDDKKPGGARPGGEAGE
ncbi:MAG TPA: type 4a pilus biogenesis protein PilO [Thermoanaerobaculia bacterium]|jgi:type IV pilus assembly protein PilO